MLLIYIHRVSKKVCHYIFDKIHTFHSMQHVILRENKLGNLFRTNILSIHLLKMSSLCMYARIQPLSHSLTAESMTFCCRPFHDINEALLQLIDVVQTAFAQSLLRDCPLHILWSMALRCNATWLKITYV